MLNVLSIAGLMPASLQADTRWDFTVPLGFTTLPDPTLVSKSLLLMPVYVC